jgi:hypothetical protein
MLLCPPPPTNPRQHTNTSTVYHHKHFSRFQAHSSYSVIGFCYILQAPATYVSSSTQDVDVRDSRQLVSNSRVRTLAVHAHHRSRCHCRCCDVHPVLRAHIPPCQEQDMVLYTIRCRSSSTCFTLHHHPSLYVRNYFTRKQRANTHPSAKL